MLGEKIQRLRKEKGLSQEQLAAQLTISRQAISKWELGESMPDTENIVQLSKLFGVTTDYLLNDEFEEYTNPENAPQAEEINIPIQKSSTQRIVGIILLCIGLIILVFTLIFSDSLAALIVGVPLIICGVICLTVKGHTALWCLWAVYLLLYIFFAIATGSGFLWLFKGMGRNTILMVVPLIPLIIVTGRIFYKIWKSKK